ncbi:MAG: 1-acyl-sn-glycerol-3-phosphate acyltransferase [Myxococcota bacterium]
MSQTFDPEAPLSLAIRGALGALANRHSHQVIGLEHVPDGPCLLVVNHSLATYDIALLMLRIWERTGRLPRALGDRRLFDIPAAARLSRFFGAVKAGHRSADNLLEAGNIVLVAPGGMREAIRSSESRYHVRWRTRQGFVKLAMRMQVPLVLAACPRADDLYTIRRSMVTRVAYDMLHLPVPVFHGNRFSLLPRSVRLVHRLAPAMQPPVLDPDDEEQVGRFHSQVVAAMEQLMEQALAD